MSIFTINGKKYNTTLGPYFPPDPLNPSFLLELKILLTGEASEEIKSPFLFDSGASGNHFKIDTFMKLCKASNYSEEWKFENCWATLAIGKPIEFKCLKRILFVKLEDNHIFNIPFIISKDIHDNIIGLRNIPEYMRWVIGPQEFYILRRN